MLMHAVSAIFATLMILMTDTIIGICDERRILVIQKNPCPAFHDTLATHYYHYAISFLCDAR